MASPIETFARFLRGEIKSVIGPGATTFQMSAVSAGMRRLIVDTALRRTIETVGDIGNVAPLFERTRSLGLVVGERTFRNTARAVVSEHTRKDAINHIDRDERVPDEAIIQSDHGYDREFMYVFEIEVRDRKTGKTEKLTVSLVSDRRFSPNDAEREFSNKYKPGYTSGGLDVTSINLVEVKRRKEPPI